MYNEYVASTGVKDWRRTMLDEELHTSYLKQLHLPKDMDNLFESDAKEFQKMMARRRTVFLLSLHFAPFLSKLFGEKTTENHCVRPPFPVKRSKTAQDAVSVFVHYATSPSQSDNKTQVFVHFPCMITTHSFRHVPQPSVKISTIADEERNPATSGRSPAGHSRVCRTYLRNSALRQTCRKPDLDPFQ